jgi:glutaredoxin
MLERRGIEVKTVNIDHNPDVLKRLKNEGHLSFPVIEMSDGSTWSGLSLKHILQS